MTKVTPDDTAKTKLYTELMLHKYINIPILLVVHDFVHIQLLPTPLHIVANQVLLISVAHSEAKVTHILPSETSETLTLTVLKMHYNSSNCR